MRAKDRIYTVWEVAREAKMSLYTIRQCLKDGRLIGHKIGRDWRVRHDDMMAFLHGDVPLEQRLLDQINDYLSRGVCTLSEVHAVLRRLQRGVKQAELSA
jgi:excisionase family DNA binding protein